MDMLNLLPAFVPSQECWLWGRKSYPSLTLVMYNTWSVNNKFSVLKSHVLEQAVDLVCMTKTWVREGETIALNQLVPLDFLVLHQIDG